MPYFRRKPSSDIEAHQYLYGQPTPNGVKFRNNVAYVTTIQGVDVTIIFGEWVVSERGGIGHYPIANDEFQRLYEWVQE